MITAVGHDLLERDNLMITAVGHDLLERDNLMITAVVTTQGLQVRRAELVKPQEVLTYSANHCCAGSYPVVGHDLLERDNPKIAGQVRRVSQAPRGLDLQHCLRLCKARSQKPLASATLVYYLSSSCLGMYWKL